MNMARRRERERERSKRAVLPMSRTTVLRYKSQQNINASSTTVSHRTTRARSVDQIEIATSTRCMAAWGQILVVVSAPSQLTHIIKGLFLNTYHKLYGRYRSSQILRHRCPVVECRRYCAPDTCSSSCSEDSSVCKPTQIKTTACKIQQSPNLDVGKRTHG